MKILSYIFLFYVGFYFYRLAENHKKNKWLFGIIGIATYFIGANFYALFLRFFKNEEINNFNMIPITLKSFFIGLLCVVILFQILSFVWSRKRKINKKEIDNIGKEKIKSKTL